MAASYVNEPVGKILINDNQDYEFTMGGINTAENITADSLKSAVETLFDIVDWYPNLVQRIVTQTVEEE